MLSTMTNPCPSHVPTQAQKDAIEAEVHRKDELTRRLRPLRAEDFETLKRELEAWRLKVCAARRLRSWP